MTPVYHPDPQEPVQPIGYYEAFEKTSVPESTQPREGVYQRERPVVVLHDEELNVPRFFSGAFFHFLFGFLRNPGGNPVFRREWYRVRRRVGFLGGMAWYWMLLASIALSFVLIPAGRALYTALDKPGTEDFFLFAYYGTVLLIHSVCNVLAFFACLGSTQQTSNKAMLDELTVTLLRPEEIAWGALIGTIFPLSWIAAFMLPTLAGIGLSIGWE
ncbi:hypothetical protein HZA57_00055, partial [Candidatus Poribacteria bacterium]|nr:hypothetical protein [Candidatus Poribacteria bacterium]